MKVVLIEDCSGTRPIELFSHLINLHLGKNCFWLIAFAKKYKLENAEFRKHFGHSDRKSILCITLDVFNHRHKAAGMIDLGFPWGTCVMILQDRLRMWLIWLEPCWLLVSGEIYSYLQSFRLDFYHRTSWELFCN